MYKIEEVCLHQEIETRTPISLASVLGWKMIRNDGKLSFGEKYVCLDSKLGYCFFSKCTKLIAAPGGIIFSMHSDTWRNYIKSVAHPSLILHSYFLHFCLIFTTYESWIRHIHRRYSSSDKILCTFLPILFASTFQNQFQWDIW